VGPAAARDAWGCRERAGGYTDQNLLGRALMRVSDEARHTTRGNAPALVER
jgi:hypothetical protein